MILKSQQEKDGRAYQPAETGQWNNTEGWGNVEERDAKGKKKNAVKSKGEARFG